MGCRTVGHNQEALIDAAKCVESGGIVIVPTENVYGFVFSGQYSDTIDKVYSIKKRPRQKGFVIYI